MQTSKLSMGSLVEKKLHFSHLPRPETRDSHGTVTSAKLQTHMVYEVGIDLNYAQQNDFLKCVRTVSLS